MEDLAGIGRATEKFLELVQSTIGTLYRPRAIRKEGEASANAEAYRSVALAKASVEARQITLDGEEALVERAIARLRHQEISKQRNLELIIDQTIPKIEEQSIDADVDKDWLSYFFESCASISAEKVQTIWSDVLASKLIGEKLPRKIIDCLRWMDAAAAGQFVEFSKSIFLFGGSFAHDVQCGDGRFSVGFRYDTDALVEIGLVKENLNKTFRFKFASLSFTCRELSDRSLEFRQFFEFTQAGAKLASIVVPQIQGYRSEIRNDYESYGTYSDRQFQLQNEIMPPDGRIKELCGSLLEFMIEADVEISVSKTIVKTEGDGQYHSSKEVMAISTQGGKLSIGQFRRGRYWKALSDFEKSALEELANTLKAYAGMIEHRPKD